MPAITVLMTAYNAEVYIDRAIKSILSQTFRDFELLIIDDASTDYTRERIQEWQQKDVRIRMIACPANRGQTVCLNQGLEEARGQWIARQDADDVSHPTRLQRLYELVRTNDKLVLVGASGWLIDANDHRCGTINVPLSDAAIRWSMPFQNPFIHTAVLFRRLRTMRYNEQFHICQDWELWARLSHEGRVCNLPDRLIEYRDYHTSLSKGRAGQTQAEAASIGRRLFTEQFPKEPWTAEIEQLLAAFRRGLSLTDHAAFWSLYERLRCQNNGVQIGNAVALHHLQVAGALATSNRRLAFANLIKAAVADLPYTIGILRDRISLDYRGVTKTNARFTKLR